MIDRFAFYALFLTYETVIIVNNLNFDQDLNLFKMSTEQISLYNKYY